MTTIVVKDYKMAADTLGIFESTKMQMQKIFRVHGGLLGVSGNYDHAIEFIRAYKKDKNLLEGPPVGEDKNDFDYLMLTEKGLYLTTGYGPQVKLKEKCFAIGSGKEAALAAMFMGASAKEAVRVAGLIDIYTGPKVVEKEL